MPQVPIPSTYRVVSIHSFTGEEIVNVVHCHKVAGGNAEMDGVRDRFHTFWVNSSSSSPKGVNDQVQIKCHLTKISVQDISTTPFPVPRETTYNVAGSDAGNPLPLQTSLVISLKTDLAGRSYRGRFYLGGITAAMNTDDGSYPRPSSTKANNVGLAFDALVTGLISDGTYMVVSSRLKRESHQVKGISIDDVFDEQRRRAKQIPRNLLFSATY
jgi:hypothetical protein